MGILSIFAHGGCPDVPVLAAAPITSVSVFQHFVTSGGWITWCVLIPLSWITLYLVLHYAVTIRRAVLVPPKLIEAL